MSWGWCLASSTSLHFQRVLSAIFSWFLALRSTHTSLDIVLLQLFPQTPITLYVVLENIETAQCLLMGKLVHDWWTPLCRWLKFYLWRVCGWFCPGGRWPDWSWCWRHCWQSAGRNVPSLWERPEPIAENLKMRRTSRCSRLTCKSNSCTSL